MDSGGRFLLGGALGAALGYLLAQKDQAEAVQSDSDQVVAASRGVRIPPPPPSDWRPAPIPTVPADGPSSTTTTEAQLPSESLIDRAAPPVSEESEPMGGAESEIILTRDFLEEPLPGSGWRPSASAMPGVPVAPEQVAEQPPGEIPGGADAAEAPAIEEVVEPSVVGRPISEAATTGPVMADESVESGPLSEGATVDQTEPTPGESRVDDLKSRIEETRRRIRHELEQPFDTLPSAGPPESGWTASTPMPAVEPSMAPPVEDQPTAVTPVPVEQAPAEQAPVEQVPVEQVPVEQVPIEEVPVEQVPVEQVPIEEVPVEQVSVEPARAAVEQMQVEQPSIGLSGAEQPVGGPAPAEPSETPLADVLPVAAESTFAPTAPEPPAEKRTGAESAAVKPVVEEPVAVEPLVVDQVAIDRESIESPAAEEVAVEPEVVEPEPVEGVRSPVDLGEELEAEPEIGLGLGEPVDYDSMKDRIERTRSRLKAKAFDAMMTGESALLGRDLEDASSGQQPVPGVDSEVDESIETSLREEEE